LLKKDKLVPIQIIPGTNVQYYLIAFDSEGLERNEDSQGLLSQRVARVLASEPITDVFLLCHGWKGDVPAAKEQYDNWIGVMAGCDADIQRMQQTRAGFRPLYIGFHWPSQPWGDEELGGAVSFASPSVTRVDELIDRYAARITDTPRARDALRTIFSAAIENMSPTVLPPNVAKAYEILNVESGLRSEGEGASPGADREPFDPELSYRAAREDDAISFGKLSLGGVLSPLRQLSFWKMKDRARQIGETGGSKLLVDFQTLADEKVHFHLMGHSFGCIVASAMLAGWGDKNVLVRPVDSAVLVQGALSIWSYCSDIPAVGQPGYFRPLFDGKKIRGPIATTQSEHDTAVGRFYPIGAGIRRQVVFGPGELPKYGGLGTFGARGPGLDIVDGKMLRTDASYAFEAGKIYNLESSQFIKDGGGASGAHNDIAKPEVAHVIWEAASS
jgi:hypothetical protein